MWHGQRHLQRQFERERLTVMLDGAEGDGRQILNHRESRERQYALADHAVALGWPRDRVLVIDDDQVLSGRWAEGRDGFQRLLAEVTLVHVGLILGIEMSRIARNNRDWHNLGRE